MAKASLLLVSLPRNPSKSRIVFFFFFSFTSMILLNDPPQPSNNLSKLFINGDSFSLRATIEQKQKQQPKKGIGAINLSVTILLPLFI